MKESDDCSRHQWRLLRRLGKHGIAGGQRRADFTDEDRERKIPRRDAGDRSDRAHVVQFAPRLRRVVAAEIDRLAHFARCVRHRLAGFANGERDETRAIALEEISGALDERCAIPGRNRAPCRAQVNGTIDRRANVVDGGIDHRSDDVVVIGRVEHLLGSGRVGAWRAGNQRPRDRLRPAIGNRALQPGQRMIGSEIDPRRIQPIRIQPRGRWQSRIRCAAISRGGGDCDGVGDERLDRHRRIDDAVDERRICAILEQPSHQIREECFVRPDGRINPACTSPRRIADDLVVQRFAHPVQTLIFEPGAGAHAPDRGNGMRVVRGELRINCIRRG